MNPLARLNERLHHSSAEVRALRPGIDDQVGAHLDRLAESGDLPIHRGRVSRRPIFAAVGVGYLSAKYLNVGGEHFARHDRLLAEAGVEARRHTNLPARITEFLRERHQAGTLEFRGRGRGVSQRWVASEMGMCVGVFRTVPGAAEALEAFNVDIDDDQPAGHRGKYNDLHVEMRAFLDAGHKAGTLEMRRDGVDKSWLARQFGVHNAIYIRYPETAEVVEAFNARVRDTLPFSPTYPTLAADLRGLIDELEAKGELPVFKDKLNEADLARRLGIIPSTFGLVPECGEILAAVNERVRFRDPTRPFHEGHGRNYSFRDLIPSFGPAGAARIARRFCDVAGPAKGTGKNQYRIVLSVVTYLGTVLPKYAVRALAIGAEIEDRVFEGALRRWRAQHLALKREPHVLSADVVIAQAVLERMALFGTATEVLVALPNAGAARPKASLAEARTPNVDRLADVVTTYSETRALDYDRHEVEAFLSNLALSRELADIAVDDLPEAIRKLNRERLDRIAACAHVVFQQGYERHATGMALLERGRGQSEALDVMLRDTATGRRKRADLLRFFTERGEEGLAAYLYHVERDHGGRLPRMSKDGGTTTADKVFYGKITRGLGGIDAVEGLLHPCERTVAAACIAYIVEAGANSAVARGLLIDCLQSSTVPGHREVSGWKYRSGQPIVTDLPIDHRDGAPSVVRALEALRELQPRLARLASAADGRHLFLVDIVGRVRPIAEHRLLHMLRVIASDDPELAGFELRIDMLRSSVLLDAALAADGNINVATAIANHSSESQTAHYVVKMPLRIIYERKIRQFQEALASIALIGVEGAAERLGLPVDKVRSLAERAMRTGLGRLCLLPTAGIQPDVPKGETCAKVQACSGCRAAVVVADIELVADLVIWHGSLVEAAETWPPEREERFMEAWLDDLAFCDAALDAMKRGPHARILRKAREAAERRLADPHFERPRPW